MNPITKLDLLTNELKTIRSQLTLIAMGLNDRDTIPSPDAVSESIVGVEAHLSRVIDDIESIEFIDLDSMEWTRLD